MSLCIFLNDQDILSVEIEKNDNDLYNGNDELKTDHLLNISIAIISTS